MQTNKQTLARRRFLGQLTATLAAPALLRAETRAAGKAKRLPLAVSTLGCPAWEWSEILKQTVSMGYAALELRGIRSEMDLTKCAEFAPTQIKATLRDLAALDLKISDLGASAMMHEPDDAKRAKHIDEAKRFIDLAQQLKAPYVRVFPNQLVKGEEKAITVARIVKGLRELGDHAKGSGVQVLVESHGEFVVAPLLLDIIEGAAHPNVAFLWDAHHTCVAGEKPAETYQQLKSYIRHTHLKDSRAVDGDPKKRQYVLLGEGEVAVKETVGVLVQNNYRGYYCFEWEKRWHSEIADPAVAFPHYAKVMGKYLREFGVKV